MPYVEPEIVQKVKEIDLLTYLQNYEPYELVHYSGNTYTTKTHDSLKISNGKWMWWSRGIGGRSALDYLIKVQGYTFLDAVQLIAGQSGAKPCVKAELQKVKEKKLLLPKENPSNERVVSYLLGRGIDRDIIEFCLKTGRLYESESYHNAVFVGRDRDGVPRYAALRGTGTDYIGDANGSDKHYSFSICASGTSEKENSSPVVHVFESAIDLLSFATLTKMNGQDWRKEHLLSLAGVYQPAKKKQDSKVPAALEQFLKEHGEIQIIELHLDNDRAGREAAEAIQTAVGKRFQTKSKPPSRCKDCNDLLCFRLGIQKTKREKKNQERKWELWR